MQRMVGPCDMSDSRAKQTAILVDKLDIVVVTNWIQRDSARQRADPNYSEDNIVINMESVGAPGVSARIVQANSIWGEI